jgi:hypothetical protein
MASRSGHNYSDIHNFGASRNHLGDVYNQYGPSPDQQAFRAVLDSLRYDGMDDRMDRLSSAEAGTFEWALAGRDGDGGALDKDDAGDEDGGKDDEDNEWYNEGDLWHSTKTIDSAFTNWLVSDEGEGNLFCFMGKPGSGKSTLMYAFSKDKTAGRCTMH